MNKVRNSIELGPILYKIALQLAKDQDLCRYLKYTSESPKKVTEAQPDVSGTSLLHKNILIVPQVNANDFETAAKICLVLGNGMVLDNNDYKNLGISILVYVPFKSWVINEIQLRPFAIINRIETILKGKRFESIGNISYSGFSLSDVDDDLACYKMDFDLDVFN